MIIFDFEVFKFDWVLCALRSSDNKWTVIHNNPNKLKEFYKEHENEIWIGYNSKNYDRFILDAIMNGKDPKSVSDSIIVTRDFKFYNCTVPAKHYDAFVKLADNEFRGIGLKTLEGMMGMSIVESDVPFNLNRCLNEEEIKSTIEYCMNDVRATVAVLRNNSVDFKASIDLVTRFNLTHSYLSKTHPQLAASILEAEPVPEVLWDKDKVRISPDIDPTFKYKEIVDFYKDPMTATYRISKDFTVAGIKHRFAWGGLHGARESYHFKATDKEKIGYIDVSQYYPTLMLEHGMLSRAVKPERYKVFCDLRADYKLKAKTDLIYKGPANTYKIIINSVFGMMNDQFSPVYDPFNFNNVVVNGQLMILDLVSHLEEECDYFEHIQSNTDGIIFKYSDIDQIKEITDAWASCLRFKYEFKEFNEIWQKDANNYLAKFKDGWFGKGSLFKELTPLDNKLAAVSQACRDYMFDGKPYKDSILDNNNLMDFQQIIKLPKNFDKAIFLKDGKTELLNTKVQRVFYSAKEEGGELLGVNNKDRTANLYGEVTFSKRGKIADADAPLKIVNSTIEGVATPKWLDKQRYIEIIEKALPDYGVLL